METRTAAGHSGGLIPLYPYEECPNHSTQQHLLHRETHYTYVSLFFKSGLGKWVYCVML